MKSSVLPRVLSPAVFLLLALPAGGAAPGNDLPAVVAALQAPATGIKPGDVVELQLRISVRAPWYVHGRIPGRGGQQPMGMRLKLPDGVHAIDGWEWPAIDGILNAGEHVLTQKLRVTAVSDPAEVKLMLSYQACNPQICLPMEMVELSTRLRLAHRVESCADRSPIPSGAQR